MPEAIPLYHEARAQAPPIQAEYLSLGSAGLLPHLAMQKLLPPFLPPPLMPIL